MGMIERERYLVDTQGINDVCNSLLYRVMMILAAWLVDVDGMPLCLTMPCCCCLAVVWQHCMHCTWLEQIALLQRPSRNPVMMVNAVVYTVYSRHHQLPYHLTAEHVAGSQHAVKEHTLVWSGSSMQKFPVMHCTITLPALVQADATHEHELLHQCIQTGARKQLCGCVEVLEQHQQRCNLGNNRVIVCKRPRTSHSPRKQQTTPVDGQGARYI